MSPLKKLLTISAGASLMLVPVGCNQGNADQPDNMANDDPDTLTTFTVGYFNEWRRERAEQTLHVTETPSNDVERQLATIRADIAASPLGQRLLDDLADTHTTIGGDRAQPLADPDTFAAYLYNLDAVLLRDTTPRGLQILFASHELRHAWQDERGLIDDGLKRFEQDHAARIFMTEADARAFAVAIAWQLKEAGDSDAWDGAMELGIYRDTAIKFEARMMERLTGKPEGTKASDADLRSAMGEAYRNWFSRYSIRAPYIDAINEERERQGGVWPGYGSLPSGLTRRLGQLPGDPRGERAPSYLTRSDLELAKHHARIAFPMLVSTLPANDDRQPAARVRFGRTL